MNVLLLVRERKWEQFLDSVLSSAGHPGPLEAAGTVGEVLADILLDVRKETVKNTQESAHFPDFYYLAAFARISKKHAFLNREDP